MAQNNNSNNNYNVLSNSDNDKEEEEEEEYLFEPDNDNKLEESSEITLKPKAERAMKNLQASFNENANAEAEKENLYFLIDSATAVMVAEDKIATKEKSKIFNKAWDDSNEESQRKWSEA